MSSWREVVAVAVLLAAANAQAQAFPGVGRPATASTEA